MARRSELKSAIDEVMGGSVTLPPDYQPPPIDAGSTQAAEMLRRVATLTPQQRRVLQMLRQGKLNKQIAHEHSAASLSPSLHLTGRGRDGNAAQQRLHRG